MPLVQKSFTLTAGSTSDNLLADTNYNFVDDAVRLRFAFAVDTAGFKVSFTRTGIHSSTLQV